MSLRIYDSIYANWYTIEIDALQSECNTPGWLCSNNAMINNLSSLINHCFVIVPSFAEFFENRCEIPTPPVNGYRLGFDWELGDEIVYACNPHPDPSYSYDLLGPTHRICLECGVWSEMEPMCALINQDSNLQTVAPKEEPSVSVTPIDVGQAAMAKRQKAKKDKSKSKKDKSSKKNKSKSSKRYYYR